MAPSWCINFSLFVLLFYLLIFFASFFPLFFHHFRNSFVRLFGHILGGRVTMCMHFKSIYFHRFTTHTPANGKHTPSASIKWHNKVVCVRRTMWKYVFMMIVNNLVTLFSCSQHAFIVLESIMSLSNDCGACNLVPFLYIIFPSFCLIYSGVIPF